MAQRTIESLTRRANEIIQDPSLEGRVAGFARTDVQIAQRLLEEGKIQEAQRFLGIAQENLDAITLARLLREQNGL